MTEEYRQALADFAKELEDGVEVERERAMRNFPDVGMDWIVRCSVRGETFRQLAQMLRERTAQRTGDEPV